MQNCIVKIINGRPVVFGEAGKDEKDALVYIFEEEEAFNAALDEGLIPVGTLIVKTYDEVEMAGGPFDDALSDVSENAVQNKVITNEINNLNEKTDALTNIFKIQQVVFETKTATANSPVSVSSSLPVIEGYSPAGIISIDTGSFQRCFISDYLIRNDNTIYLGLWNAYGVDTEIHPNANVLYVKSNLVQHRQYEI